MRNKDCFLILLSIDVQGNWNLMSGNRVDQSPSLAFGGAGAHIIYLPGLTWPPKPPNLDQNRGLMLVLRQP